MIIQNGSWPSYRISTPTLKNRHPPCADASTGVHGSP